MTIDYDAHPELIAAGRELDRALWPVIDRICARLGLTRAALAAAPTTTGDDGSHGDAPAREATRIASHGGNLPPMPAAVAGDPPAARRPSTVPAAGGPRQSTTARAAAPTPTSALVEQGGQPIGTA